VTPRHIPGSLPGRGCCYLERLEWLDCSVEFWGETLARKSAQQNAQVKSPHEAGDYDLPARALLAQGKLRQAQIAIARATLILEKSKDLHPSLEAAIKAAQIRATLDVITP